MKKKRETRIVNNYVVVYKPEHPYTFQSENWKGWVYEHKFVIENEIGRELTDDEVIHHLDGNRANNAPENLILLANRSYHARIHHWIDAGAKMHESYIPKKSRYYGVALPLCKVCSKSVTDHVNDYCSVECMGLDNRKVTRPSEKDLIELLSKNNYLYASRIYGVSDNAIRKWVKAYGYNPKTLIKENNND